MRLLLIFILMLSCDTSPPVETRNSSEPESEDSISVCYNVNSPVHGQICSEECFENYTDTEFCWTLTREDCSEPLEYEWQEKNCHLFD